MSTANRRIELYDTTLRDGAQGEGVSFPLPDKLKITQQLDALGIDYIEGGYPLSNPKDVAYFEQVQKLTLKHAKVCAFGMTRRKGISPADDTGMKALVASQAPVITIVGKTWDLHVDEILGVSRDENLAMIRDSVAFCAQNLQPRGGMVFYDAEHFFDGYRANRDYAMATLRAALEGGAVRVILCDTNGGSLPAFVTQAISDLKKFILTLPRELQHNASGAGVSDVDALLGIHVHNDGGLAVANSLAAVEAGAVQVQGTINGIGERCGNVDLTTVAANLALKMGYEVLTQTGGSMSASLAKLTETSRFVYELANLNLVVNQPYVGPSAFAHKGGMHVHAIQKVAHSYEHIVPDQVGNTRRVLVSELAGVSNVSATLGERFPQARDRAVQKKLIDRVAELENQGYQFESAGASFELLLHEVLGTRPTFWKLDHYRCVIYKHDGDKLPMTEA
ncbi:MAG: citramalate synthase, partial [Phycisphaerales bacterium]|nr:citramalate synthase [Phycisphaerales bacterium]